MRHLIDLIRAVPEALSYPEEAANLPVTSITADSRRVTKGSLFAALKGTKTDGTAFIEDVKVAGAAAVLCDQSATIDAKGIALIRSHNPRKALAHMAAAFYARQPEHIVAITGTDGKTSTADFFRQFCYHNDRNAASVGTLGVLVGDGEELHAGSHTTPDAVDLHKMLAEMTAHEITHVSIEASSHGLDQSRLDGVRFQAGAFTNIARDHLDYHHTEENYFNAKARLFAEVLPKGATAVINQDDVRFDALAAICKQRDLRVLGYGKQGKDLQVLSITPQPDGQLTNLRLMGKEYRLRIPVVGGFQVMNILAAIGLAMGTGMTIEELLEFVPELKGVPGRLQLAVRHANGAAVYVDYAHTPMALANILQTLKPHTQGKLRVVFGCGGDRDTGKRSEMGKAACELADDVIVTDDNPRTENPALIRQAILSGCAKAKEVADRREAIYVALRRLEPGDVLVLAGKGHEKTQIIGNKVLPFDDVEVARQCAKELKLSA
ncbi:MAG: UDP-N-acetylmuramoyl-L-alanyl-D-glutamate--2,6-diaminopimelate ligase [Rickettsiales bacterium]|nr:UDP-N-acetylmuramoyl-L-alanyl-D-glutamate--2,6-diaminopimelate ligase [Rickettsiales bacterium]